MHGGNCNDNPAAEHIQFHAAQHSPHDSGTGIHASDYFTIDKAHGTPRFVT